jgi:hypothetical protein
MEVKKYGTCEPDLEFPHDHYISLSDIDESNQAAFNSGGSVEISTGISVPLEEVLTEIPLKYISDHLETRLVNHEFEALATIHGTSLMEYLVEEYQRGSFSDFDFSELFKRLKLNISYY